MSFIVPTERRHWKTRALLATMYLLLVAGAISMVYPFLLMLSGSVKSDLDFDQFEIIPSYWYDDQVLFQKFELARYKGNAWRFQLAARSTLEAFEDIRVPRINEPRVLDLWAFFTSGQVPPDFVTPGQTHEPGAQPRVLREFRNWLVARFDGDLDRLNRRFGLTLKNWDEVTVPEVEMLGRTQRHGTEPLEVLYRTEFRPHLPARAFWPIHVEGVFHADLRGRYRRSIEALNLDLGTKFQSFADVPLPRRYPAGEPHAPAWERFVREVINLEFLRLRTRREPGRSEVEMPLPARCPESGPGYYDFKSFIEDGDCLPFVEIDSFEFRYRDFLQQKYGSIDAVNAAYGTQYGSTGSVPLHLVELDAWILREHRGEVLWEFLTRNYRHSFSYLVLRGRAFWVTFLYCGLNVLLHMLVNPLAAYAMSRYRFRWAHWVLLFCVLTMAFPAEVGGIPRFLLLRELGLLNTIWALVLPGAAHGFSIFILKGFFDGLPSELYEAARIEGAPEHWMFRHVTLALTKPILAVIAFGAFTSAYGGFMFALIVCPDERMWTISVWLYQFQQSVTEPVAFSALVLASLPVLGAFLLAQRFILQGIVLPVEK